ncbi:ATP-binding cassette domain-containing protein [Streptomonospora nanhaiensis]|uniref:ATP-binding cassette domain-containing protein n=1 Tax=Streptomonospora nanhaiensis TaxID=1323731 RepID=UPI001C38C998|nr:excinuclease ABC subunit UvrA [Streptomonospora nanhaiensis]MBV2362947.1 excinuclease ABC subunit UvrA [Streptomonospora nanhaiensis]
MTRSAPSPDTEGSPSGGASTDAPAAAPPIVIRGARVHNLKDVSVEIPKNRIVVFTGVSGSGKSSLVFGTVAQEAQRQLNDTYPAFVRGFLPKYEKPEADHVDNLSAAIVVDQKPVGGNSRSTVGTATDIHPQLRVLFSRMGEPSAGMSSAYSFNTPAGACPECQGLGRKVGLDPDTFFDLSRSLNDGGVRFRPFEGGIAGSMWTAVLDGDKPLGEFTEEEWHTLLHGGRDKTLKVPVETGSGTYNMTYEGIADRFERLYLKRDISGMSKRSREAVQAVIREGRCPACDGARLAPAALASRIDGRNIADWTAMELDDLIGVLEGIDHPQGTPIARSAAAALRRLSDIGLGYLSLDRETTTLSGGEAQRLKMVRYLGSSLVGMTYVFDEPSTGLHPHDVGRLNRLLKALRDRGNTVLVVEHDRDVIAIADHVIDMGPLAGANGGQVVYAGPPEGLRAGDTLTGRCLRRTTGLKEAVREPRGWLRVDNARRHNLKDVSVAVPTGVLTVFTGVAGSGKSTLVTDVFAAAHPDAVLIGQQAITASSRSTPASFLGIMDPLRKSFADANRVDPGMFSFNSKGACSACGGRGEITAEMSFMDPVTMVCEACEGRRYDTSVLAYRLRGRTIAEVMAMTAEEAAGFLTEPRIAAQLRQLIEVGLGYLTLGQELSSLSGGERRRLKLATHLTKRGGLYIIDEPTNGLHMADVDTLLALLDRLVDARNTVVVIEHDLDVVKHADWVIDLGPHGGKDGGRIMFEGTPHDLVKDEHSLTARHLRADLAAAG